MAGGYTIRLQPSQYNLKTKTVDGRMKYAKKREPPLQAGTAPDPGVADGGRADRSVTPCVFPVTPGGGLFTIRIKNIERF